MSPNRSRLALGRRTVAWLPPLSVLFSMLLAVPAAAEEGPDSVRSASVGEPEQQCEVDFKYDDGAIGRGIDHALLEVIIRRGSTQTDCHTGTVTVQFRHEGYGVNPAMEDVHYRISKNSLEFDVGDSREVIGLHIINDGDFKGEKKLRILFTGVSGGGLSLTNPVQQMIVTINPGGGPTQSAPGAPSNLDANPGDEQVTLNWGAPSNTGTTAITHYQYRVGSGGWTTVSGGPSARQRVVTGLNNGTSYTFGVRAVNSVGDGVVATVSATPTGGTTTPSLRIANATVGEAAGSATLTVTLSPSVDQRVTVSYATSNGTATSGSDYTAANGTLSFDAGETSQTITVANIDDDRDEGTELFNVTLSNASGADADIADGSATVTINDNDGTTQDPDTPGPPRSLSAEAGDGVVTLSWSPPASNGGASVTEYEYRYRETENSGGFGSWQSAPRGGQAREATVDQLTNGTRYTFEVRARNSEGPGPAASTNRTPRAPGLEPSVTVTPRRLVFQEGGSDTYSIVLGAQPTGDVTVRMTANLSRTDLSVEPEELEFTESNWSDRQTITVSAEVDEDADDEPEVVLTHSASGGGYGDVTVPSVTVEVQEGAVPVVRADDASGPEEAGELVFHVSLNTESTKEVTVDYATANGTAIAGRDYTATSGTLTFAPGTTRGTVVVPLLDDNDDEEEETFQLELFDPVNALVGTVGGRLVRTGTITDDDFPEVTVSFSTSSYTVREGGRVTVELELDGDPKRTAGVGIQATGGRGVQSTDYSVPDAVHFRSGETRQTIDFSALGDRVDEDDEVVTLSLVSSLPKGFLAGEPSATEITITDDDRRGVTVSEESLEVREGSSGSYSVGLGSQPSGPVTIAITGSPSGSDVRTSPPTLLFTEEDWWIRRTVVVYADHDDDALRDPVVTLRHRVNGADYTGAAAGSVRVTVIEDDKAALSVADGQATEGAGQVVFAVTLDVQSDLEVRASYNTIGGTAVEGVDYVRKQGTVVFAPRQTRARIVVPLHNDRIDEEDETFFIRLNRFVNANQGVNFLSATGTIVDDDLPSVRIAPVERLVLEGGIARFRLTRPGEVSDRLRVPVTVTETGGFLAGAAPSAVTFARNSDEAILALRTTDDALDEMNGTISVTLGRSNEYEIAGPATATVTIADNDATPAFIISGAQVAESAGEIRFPVALRGASAYAVTAVWITSDLTATAGEDYESASGTITIPAGQTSGSIRVAVLDDLLPEEKETFTVTLSNPANAVLEVGSATGTITDDDEAVTRAWLSRFGRTVASQVVDGISDRLGRTGAGQSLWNANGQAASLSARAADGREVGFGDLLDRSSFQFSTGARGQVSGAAGAGAGVTVWVRGMRTDFSGADASLPVEASVVTGLAGLDYERGRVLVGVAGSYSFGDGGVTRAGSGATSEGDIQTTLIGAYPYLRLKIADRVSLWGLGGAGLGEMWYPGTSTAKNGIMMYMGAAGARGELFGVQGTGFGVAIKSDAFMVRMETEAGVSSAATLADANRVRALLEVSNSGQLSANSVFGSSVEAGLRRDDGDAETGLGVELGGALKFANSAAGLRVEATVRGLVSHEDTDFAEWGVGGSIVFQPGGSERGLSVRMRSSWGVADGSAEDLWSPYGLADRARRGDILNRGRMAARVHYGIAPFGDHLSMAPYAEIRLDGDRGGSRLGWRFNVMESLRLSLDYGTDDGRGVMIRGSMNR